MVPAHQRGLAYARPSLSSVGRTGNLVSVLHHIRVTESPKPARVGNTNLAISSELDNVIRAAAKNAGDISGGKQLFFLSHCVFFFRVFGRPPIRQADWSIRVRTEFMSRGEKDAQRPYPDQGFRCKIGGQSCTPSFNNTREGSKLLMMMDLLRRPFGRGRPKDRVQDAKQIQGMYVSLRALFSLKWPGFTANSATRSEAEFLRS